MASSLSGSTVAGILVAFLGIVPLGWFALRSTEGGEPDSTTTTVPTEELQRVPVEVAPPGVGELDDAVSRVLYASGNAEAVGEQVAELPPEVVRVLVYYDVTLAVPVTPQPEAAP